MSVLGKSSGAQAYRLLALRFVLRRAPRSGPAWRGPHARAGGDRRSAHNLGIVLTLSLAVACTTQDPVGLEDWQALGLEGEHVSALAETDWGLVAGTRAGVYRLDAASGQWQAAGLEAFVVSDLVFLSSPIPKLLAAVAPGVYDTTEAAVFATEDGGTTWRPWDGGVAASDGYQFWAFSLAADPVAPSLLFMGGGYSILKSEDGGRNWRFVWGGKDQFGGGIGTIGVSQQGDGRVWAGGQTAFDAAVLVRSADHGDTWTDALPLGAQSSLLEVVVGDLERPGHVWAAFGGAGVWRSDDGGTNWERSLDVNVYVHALVFLGGALYAVSRELMQLPDDQLGEKLRVFRFRSGWDELIVPAAHGGLSAIVDRNGHLVVGTSASGVWRLIP